MRKTEKGRPGLCPEGWSKMYAGRDAAEVFGLKPPKVAGKDAAKPVIKTDEERARDHEEHIEFMEKSREIVKAGQERLDQKNQELKLRAILQRPVGPLHRLYVGPKRVL